MLSFNATTLVTSPFCIIFFVARTTWPLLVPIIIFQDFTMESGNWALDHLYYILHPLINEMSAVFPHHTNDFFLRLILQLIRKDSMDDSNSKKCPHKWCGIQAVTIKSTTPFFLLFLHCFFTWCIEKMQLDYEICRIGSLVHPLKHGCRRNI